VQNVAKLHIHPRRHLDRPLQKPRQIPKTLHRAS
jgi:hypothetical protein